MSKSLNFILLSSFVLVLLGSGCNRLQSAATNNRNTATAAPTVNANANNAPNQNSRPIVNANAADKTSLADDDEIKSCSPEKLYMGAVLTVTFNQPHGGYAAIRRMNDNKWFFLNDAENSEPVWGLAEFKTLSEIKINAATAVNTTNSETAEKIFNKTGKYLVMVSDQDFGQDDPPATGICEVEYVHQKRLKK